MFTKRLGIRSLIIAAITLGLLSGVAFAVVTITKNVSATVRVQVDAPDGIEIYLDDALTQPAEFIDFGEVSADVFGSVAGEPPSVPVWIKNVSFSEIRLSLDDDFAHGDVVFQGGVQEPVLQPDEVLAGVLTLTFSQGVPGEFNFAVAVRAEGPLGEPTPSGNLTIAVGTVDTPNGLPRFCTAGCAETIYLSGITETLFNSKANPDGTAAAEPMLAMSFELDPTLEFGTFNLRQGVQFHNGWGEMTANDVAFSFNDANSVTNPESIHGQAGDFAPIIASMQPLDTYTVRLNYRNFDSRGLLHRFSMFWQTAGIVSYNVFNSLGVEGMQSALVGVGPFVADQWTDDQGIFLSAFPDYYGRDLGLGPFVETVRYLEVPANSSRVAMLQTGEAQIADIPLKDVPALKQMGFTEHRGALFFTMDNVSFTGNYWEQFSALTGEQLQRERDTSKPWVGNPFENGDTFDANTPSMVSSRHVRQAFAWDIPRQGMLDNLLLGLGFTNHQPYLSKNNPNYQGQWSWGDVVDAAMARAELDQSNFPNGFEMDLWVGTGELQGQMGEVMGATWQQDLNVKVNLIKTVYSTYRPGLVARTTSTPFIGCADENKSNFPYDWAHGFVMSSISAGGYGVGMEVPFASEAYLSMAAEPDKAKREALSAAFYQGNRDEALCVGIFERPLWPVYNPNLIDQWNQLPNANGNLYGINNIRSVQLK